MVRRMWVRIPPAHMIVIIIMILCMLIFSIKYVCTLTNTNTCVLSSSTYEPSKGVAYGQIEI